MEFKDYYAALGIDRTAPPEEVKRAYRKLARRYHPDVSKEPQAESRFKEVLEAYEALQDPEKRSAYDDLARRQPRGQPFQPGGDWRGTNGAEPGGRDGGAPASEPSDFSEFFASVFSRQAQKAANAYRAGMAQGAAPAPPPVAGEDHHAKVAITVEEAYLGGRRTLQLRLPVMGADGRVAGLRDQAVEVALPPGLQEGQHLRLPGQGAPGIGGAPAGDLFLQISLEPHPRWRVEGRDVYVTLPVAPWEAALGAQLPLQTPAGELTLNVSAGSGAGRRFRLKGRGLPGEPPGDLYAVLKVVLPRAETTADREAFQRLAEAFPGFDPRPSPSNPSEPPA